jgi:tryptophan synthase
VTGSSASATMSASLPELCERVRKYAGKTPIAVGFGVNTREHFLSVGDIADGVVIGSKIVSLIKEASPGKAIDAIRAYCKEVSRPRTADEQNRVSDKIGQSELIDIAKVDTVSVPSAVIARSESEANGFSDEVEVLKIVSVNGNKAYEVPQKSEVFHSNTLEIACQVRRVWRSVRA